MILGKYEVLGQIGAGGMGMVYKAKHRRMKREVAVKVLPANLYRRIRTLLDQGLIEESGNRPDPEVDDQRRRYFAVTPLGEAVAQAEAKRLRNLLAGAGDLASELPG